MIMVATQSAWHTIAASGHAIMTIHVTFAERLRSASDAFRACIRPPSST